MKADVTVYESAKRGTGFEKAFYYILSVEGVTLSREEYDKGLISKFGITLGAWSEFTKKQASFDDIKNLTLTQAKRFYRAYWDALKLDRVKSLDVAISIFDQCVHRGRFGGTEMTQRFLNLRPTGIMTDQTLEAINSVEPDEFITGYFKHAQRSYLKIVEKDQTQMKFLKGWFERTYKILDSLKFTRTW